jgi:hypothetical protein
MFAPMRPLFAILAILLAGPAPADTSALPGLAPLSAEASLGAIARLRSASAVRDGCTAVLVAPDLALTAGHCARGPVSGPNAMQLIFRPDATPPAFRATVRAVAFHAGHDRGPLTARNAHADLALLRLARPVPGEVARPIPLSDGTPADLVAIYGYLNGAGDALRGHPGCRLGALGPGLLGSDCRVEGGLSGAPVLSGGPGDWRLEGIAVARVADERVRAFVADVVPWPDFAGPYATGAPATVEPASKVPPPSEGGGTSP